MATHDWRLHFRLWPDRLKGLVSFSKRFAPRPVSWSMVTTLKFQSRWWLVTWHSLISIAVHWWLVDGYMLFNKCIYKEKLNFKPPDNISIEILLIKKLVISPFSMSIILAITLIDNCWVFNYHMMPIPKNGRIKFVQKGTSWPDKVN